MDQSPVAIVTGASSGIGRASALLLADAGYHVALLARREELLRELASEIHDGAGRDVLALPTDVTDYDAVRCAVDAVLERYGRIDAVVNAAGDGPNQPMDDITPELWRQCVDGNLSSVVYMTRCVWPAMRKQGSGVIVNLSSLASVDPFRGFNIYAAAKAGVNLFTHCTADEGAAHGIKAVAIAPGAVETPMLRRNFGEDLLPRDRTLDPADLATVIRDCITGQRDYTPGETIQVPSP
jgi:NAD(P)-dependent dehydrogenase (short-subunit alcohol dehydrogenase family)